MSQQAIVSYIGLGSNLPAPDGTDSFNTLQAALRSLSESPKASLTACSSCYLSDPIGPQDQGQYFNAVAEVSFSSNAFEALELLQGIENAFGRNREKEQRWGARSLDLDLLLFGGEQIFTPKLIIPHPEIENRHFVLLPLYELAPDLILPNGKNIKTLAENCQQNGIIRLSESLWSS